MTPQLTGQFWDKFANRLHLAFPAGWGNPVWSKIMAKALIDTILQISLCEWVVCEIPGNDEKTFTRYISRKYKQVGIPSRYFTIRVKERYFVTAHVFISGLPLKTFKRYQPEYIHKPGILKIRLNQLLDYRRHPDIKGTRRFSCSHILSHELRLIRVHTLIDMAMNGENHDLYKLPTLADIHSRLTAYLKADLPLIAGLNTDKKLSLLRETSLLSKYDISTIEKHLDDKSKWQLVLVYCGNPADGAKMDEVDGRFNVMRLSEFAVISIWIEIPDADGLAWELVPYPNSDTGN
ncbi:MAG: hypothetical protein JW712_04545 [Dehalococcoidales bacterium]|nr:hypothetical protein [Dehalococcoidales bacterium]